MVVLGLGSNLGDRLANLRRAYLAIKKISGLQVKQVSPVYISDALLPPHAPPEWDKPYLNLALRCETHLAPIDLLFHIKTIEAAFGKHDPNKRWAPRAIDIDLLAFDDLIIKSDKLTVPHENLIDRPFALWPLADVAPLWAFPLAGRHQGRTAAEMSEKWGRRELGNAPLHTKQINQRIDTPELVGILNITPDSFSDGNEFIEVEKALAHAKFLVAAGASVLDIGAESTAPHARPLSPEIEWQRLQPILLALQAAREDFILRPKISIDTRHVGTARKALNLGADWINDVTGCNDPAMRELIASKQAECVIMHHVSIPADCRQALPRHSDPVKIIYDWAATHIDQLVQMGTQREKIIFDPGIGFGKCAEHSLWLIKNASVFAKLNTRLMLGFSRKSFMTLFTAAPAKDRDIETLAIAMTLLKQPIDYLRVHNVEMCTRGFKVAAAMGQ